MGRGFSKAELEKVCSEVAGLAKNIGEFIIKELDSFDTNKIEYKAGANDMVSYVDTEAEKKLVEGLKKIVPEAAFITEEGTVESEANELQWIIDPLDGTTNFLHQVPIFSVSIALKQNDTLIIGVVYDPIGKECFYAFKGGGAFCNGKSLKASAISELNQSLLVTGFPYSMLDKQDAYIEILAELATSTHGLRMLGSTAINLAYVAAGRFEGYVEFNVKIWDVAAGILLVQEAGGTVTDFSGENDYISGREVLAGGAAHQAILNTVTELWNHKYVTLVR